jgi:hypothetical protein
MTALRWWLGHGDPLPAFAAIVTDDNNNALDLTGATLSINLQRISGAYITTATGPHGTFQAPLFLADPSNGLVYYDWQGSGVDTADRGVHALTVSGTLANGTDIAAPTDGRAQLIIW